MSRVQLALNVTDIGAAVDFYSNMFATAPAKLRPGYANFAISDPPLKLVLIENLNETAGTINHLGVEVASTDEVMAARDRLAANGLGTTLEEKTSCCYAVQDKVWVNGPGGQAWEIYTVLADAEMPSGQLSASEPGEAGCCATGPGQAGASIAATTCC